MKFCPNCGAGVEPGTESCKSCGTDLVAAQTAIVSPAGLSASAPPAGATVVDLTPRELRREIRWGVFQGILLVAAIVFVVYLVVFLVILGAVGVGGLSGG